MCPDRPRDRWDKNIKINKATAEKNTVLSNEDVMIAWDDSHIMIDLILVNEDTCIFGNEISIQGDVSRGT